MTGNQSCNTLLCLTWLFIRNISDSPSGFATFDLLFTTELLTSNKSS